MSESGGQAGKRWEALDAGVTKNNLAECGYDFRALMLWRSVVVIPGFLYWSSLVSGWE